MKPKTNRVLLTLVLVLVTVFLLQGNFVWAKDKPVKLKVGNVFPPPKTSLMSDILKNWEDEVTKRTNGLITFQTFWGCALGSPPEHYELAKMGTCQVPIFWDTGIEIILLPNPPPGMSNGVPSCDRMTLGICFPILPFHPFPFFHFIERGHP